MPLNILHLIGPLLSLQGLLPLVYLINQRVAYVVLTS